MSIINFKEKIPEFEKFLTDKIFEIEASDYEDYYYSDGTYDYP